MSNDSTYHHNMSKKVSFFDISRLVPDQRTERRAIQSYLEEMADATAVKRALSKGGKSISWMEVKRRHGLGG